MNAEKNRSLDEQELVVVVGSVSGKLECEALVVRFISYQNDQLKALAASSLDSSKNMIDVPLCETVIHVGRRCLLNVAHPSTCGDTYKWRE